jgi:hypothetical protein
MRKAVALTLATLGLAAPAFAEDQVKDYLAARNKTADQIWLQASESGLSWANAELANKPGAKQLYCSPGAMALTRIEVVRIFEGYIKKHPDTAELPLGLALKDAMEEAFPC